MIRFKPLLIVFIVLLSGFNLSDSKPYLTKWVISKGCSLKVGGSTNVNKFSCVITNHSKPDTLTFYKGASAEAIKIEGSMRLDVQNFDCHNPMMTNDLRKTLKSKEFPDLIIRFINLSRYPKNDKNDAVKGAVTIELAGVTKRFDVDYKFIPEGPHSATLIGIRQVHFSDFNIVPPRKIGGMIKTNNELAVEFNLKVRVLN